MDDAALRAQVRLRVHCSFRETLRPACHQHVEVGLDILAHYPNKPQKYEVQLSDSYYANYKNPKSLKVSGDLRAATGLQTQGGKERIGEGLFSTQDFGLGFTRNSFDHKPPNPSTERKNHDFIRGYSCRNKY